MLQSLWDSTQGAWVTQVVEVFQESDLPKDGPTFWVTERVAVLKEFPEAPLYTRAAYALYCAVLKHRPTVAMTKPFEQVAAKACDYRNAVWEAPEGVGDGVAQDLQRLLQAAMDTLPGQGIVVVSTGEISAEKLHQTAELLKHPRILFVICRPYCEETRFCPPHAWPTVVEELRAYSEPQPETTDPEPFLIYLD